MIWLNPQSVTLGTVVLDNVDSVSIDRTAARTALEFTDAGPYPGFVDVPEQRVDVRITRRITASHDTGLRPGDSVLLTMRRAPGASAAGVSRVQASVVIASIEHSMSASRGATQRIEAIGVSSDGASDPVVVTPDTGEV